MVTAVSTQVAEAERVLGQIVSSLEAGIDAMDRAREFTAEFERGEMWRPLGFQSMAACMADRLRISRQHAYRVMAKVQVSGMLSAASGATVRVSQSEAAAVQRAPESVEVIARRIKAGEPTRAVVRQVTAAYPKPVGKKRHRGYDPEAWLQRERDFINGQYEAITLTEYGVGPQHLRAIETIANRWVDFAQKAARPVYREVE